jgi:hypothetical protein
MPHTLPVDAPTLQELEAAALVIGRLEGVAVAMASIQHAAGLQDAGIGNAQIARGMNGGGGGHGRARDASEGIKGIQTLNQGQKKKRPLLHTTATSISVFSICTSCDK